MKHDLFVCECNYSAHQMIISYDDEIDDWDMVHVEIHLANYMNFWERLWHGLKYIFGYKSPTGAFDGLTLNPDDVDRLQEIVNHLRIAKAIKDKDEMEINLRKIGINDNKPNNKKC
jgi:hypothetical protein